MVVLLSMIWSTSTLGEVHPLRYYPTYLPLLKSISVNLLCKLVFTHVIRVQALHNEQQQVLTHGARLARLVTMVLVVTHGVET